MGTATKKSTKTVYDEKRAQRAYAQTAANRAAVGKIENRPRLDMTDVAILALKIANDIQTSRRRFGNIAKSELDPATVALIEPAAWALWFAALAFRDASATSSDALVPVDVVARATALRTTMLKVLTHQFDETTAVGLVLADIRSGTGHADLASDLTRLAQLYVKHAKVLANDHRFYAAADAAKARTLATEILESLGLDRGTGPADDMYAAFTVLSNAYADVQAAALFLFRNENGQARYPSLFSVRADPSPRKSPTTNTQPASPGAAS